MAGESKYKPEFAKMLAAHFQNRRSFESFAVVVGVDRTTLYDWVKTHPEFQQVKAESQPRRRVRQAKTENQSKRTNTGNDAKIYGYSSWQAMKQRCSNPSQTSYRYYGGRGIKVCARWDDFEVFIADMGPRPDGYSIDRINPDGNYEPGNCRWADRKTQARNTRCVRSVTVNGVTRLMVEVAEEIGVERGTIRRRIRLGQKVDKPKGEWSNPKMSRSWSRRRKVDGGRE